jgi:hypothetical protein
VLLYEPIVKPLVFVPVPEPAYVDIVPLYESLIELVPSKMTDTIYHVDEFVVIEVAAHSLSLLRLYYNAFH